MFFLYFYFKAKLLFSRNNQNKIYERDIINEDQTKHYLDIESLYTISLEYYETEDKIIFPTPYEVTQKFVVEDL